ncbi:MAG: tRNA (N6-threonylcarbamoyladenosine(37)-N6)-methyltransferase TrmO [Nitrososphaerota archaeon]
MSKQEIVMKPIGYVKTEAGEEELRRRRKDIVSEIYIDEEFVEGLEGIEEYSHLFVIFWMHKVPKEEKKLKVHPRGREDLPLVGIFATRGRSRPNPIGLAVVELLERDRERLKVRALDAIDGTPVLDIKPYDYIDVMKEVRVPRWWLEIHKELKG